MTAQEDQVHLASVGAQEKQGNLASVGAQKERAWAMREGEHAQEEERAPTE